MQVKYSPRFKRKFKKLPKRIQKKAIEKIKHFKNKPFDDSLETHKLKGRLKGLWSFSINSKYRIIFEFDKKKKTAYLHTTGDHSIYS